MERDMRNVPAHSFSCTVSVFDQPITACVLITDEGIQATVCGGEKSHIGAVSIIAPDGTHSDTQFPGHKDLVIASGWARALHDAGYCPVVVCAGIHYDNLDKAGIGQVIEAADALLRKILMQLKDAS